MTSLPETRLEAQLDALLSEAPFVRRLAQTLARGDSNAAEDLEQQTWLQVLQHGPDRLERPRSWLAKVVRSVAANSGRGDRRRRDRERRAARPDRVPSSAELAMREERRRELVRFVDALPAAERAVVLLRYFEGLPPRAVARHLGQSIETVTNLQRRGISRLRRALDRAAADHNLRSRSAWLLPLAVAEPLAPVASPTAAATAPATTTSAAARVLVAALPGALAMTKSKVVGSLFAVLALGAAIAYLTWRPGAPGAPSPVAAGTATAPELHVADMDRGDAVGVVRDAAGRADASPHAPEVPETPNRLIVTVRHGEPQDVAQGVAIYVRRRAEDPLSAQRGVTDEQGVVRFDVAPGNVVVWDNRFGALRLVEIAAEGDTELEWSLPNQMNVSGRVTDEEGRAVAGARIEVAMPGLVGRHPQVVATTRADGTYEVRSLTSLMVVSARAHGFVASPTQMAHAEFDPDVTVDFVLQPHGGSVAGQVVDAEGAPREGVLVCVGDAPLVPEMNTESGLLPALVRTDADGRFVAVGLEAGDHPIWARGVDHAIWRGSVSVASHGTTEIWIQLERGSTVSGIVRSGDGIAVAAAEVRWGDWFDPAHMRVRADGEGRYAFVGLAAGRATVYAEHDDHGKCEQVVEIGTEGEVSLDLTLSKGLQLLGRVVDAKGDGVASVHVEATAARTIDDDHFYGYARTDGEGRFSVDNCPPGRTLRVEVSGEAIEARSWPTVDPAQGKPEFVVRRAAAPTSHILGTLVSPEGLPVTRAEISVWTEDGTHRPPRAGVDERGAFAIGPLPAGNWRCSIRAEGYPSLSYGPRALAGGERWDLGPVALPRGGTATIDVDGEDPSAMGFMLRHPGTGSRWVPMPRNGVVRTPILQPDRYELRAWGPRTPAQLVSVDIVAGQTTTVRVRAGDGVPQRFVFETEDGRLPPSGGQLTVFAGEQQLVDTWLQAPRTAPWHQEFALRPGVYRARLGSQAFEGEAVFTVGDAPGETVTIVVKPKG